MPPPDEDLISRSPSVLATQVDDRLMVMHLDTSRFFSLDAIAGAVWEQLEIPCSVNDLIARLSARYDAGAGVIAADVRSLLDRMAADGLVERG